MRSACPGRRQQHRRFSLIGHNAASTIEPSSLRRRARKKQKFDDGDIIQTAGVDLLSAAIHLLFGAALADLFQ